MFPKYLREKKKNGEGEGRALLGWLLLGEGGNGALSFRTKRDLPSLKNH